MSDVWLLLEPSEAEEDAWQVMHQKMWTTVEIRTTWKVVNFVEADVVQMNFWTHPQEEVVDEPGSALQISPARLLPAELANQSVLEVPALLWGARRLVERYGAKVSKVSESVGGFSRRVVQLRVHAAAEQTAEFQRQLLHDVVSFATRFAALGQYKLV
eukprot:6477113-Amphidinium_carterae.1